MASVHASCVVYRKFYPWSYRSKDKDGYFCFFDKHTLLKSKYKHKFDRNHDKLLERSDI